MSRGPRRLIEGSEQIEVPCRYCAAPCLMSKAIIENMLRISAKTIEKRGEAPIKRSEVAVCAECRPRYEDEFCPRTITIDVPPPDVSGAFTPDDSPDGFGPPDEQTTMGY